MKFILGYRKGTKSKFYDGPELIWQLATKHKDVRYFFTRMAKVDGKETMRLAVYDTNDYPDDMIMALVANNQIVEWEGQLFANEVDIATKKGKG